MTNIETTPAYNENTCNISAKCSISCVRNKLNKADPDQSIKLNWISTDHHVETNGGSHSV